MMKNFKAKYFLLLIMLPLIAIGQESKVSKKEVSTFLQSYIGKEINQTILSSDGFKECFEKGQKVFDNPKKADASIEDKYKARNEEIRKCTADKFINLPDDQIQSLANQFQLESFDKKAAKSATSIRAYLSKRLEEALYGQIRDANGNPIKLSERQYTDHSNFYQLYMEQIGKNTLLLASQYCLENFGAAQKDSLVQIVPGTNRESLKIIRGAIVKSGDEYTVADDLKDKFDAKDDLITVKGFWRKSSELVEYEVCSGDENCENEKGKRSVKLVTALKNASFKLAETNVEAVSDNYKFCAGQVIRNMCEVYKCNNIYKNNPDNKDKCNDFDITPSKVANPSTEPDKRNTTGQVACNLMEQLRSYRRALLATKEIQNQLSGQNAAGRTVIQGMGINQYNNSGDKSIDNLTSISSTELTENVGDIANAEERAKELREQCLEETDPGTNQIKLKEGAAQKAECKEIMAQLSAEDIANITADSEAKTDLMVKRLDGLENSSKDELIKFLQENNLNEYLSKLEGESDEKGNKKATLTEKKLIELIKNDFLTKKNAELDAIKQRFQNEMKIASGETTDASSEKAANDVASQTVSDIEEHKNRVQTLFQYSNIVSSYLDVTGGENGSDAPEQTANVTGRRLEISDSKNPDDTKLLQYFSEGSDQKSTGGTRFDYNDVFSAIIDGPPDS